MSTRIPKYRLHKGSGQALVQIAGRRIYLGPHGSDESHQLYRRLVGEWLSHGETLAPTDHHDRAPREMTINELVLAYWKFASSYYVKAGKPTDEQMGIRAAVRALRRRLPCL